MGCNFSCKRSSRIKKIRIIHLNGYIEELDCPVTVSELTGKPAQSFLFTQAQLLSPAMTPLKSDVVLELGRVYFLLPLSLFQSNVSPVDLAPIIRKLASIARNNGSMSGSRKSLGSSCLSGRIPVNTSPMRWPNRLSMQVRTSPVSSPNRVSMKGSIGVVSMERGIDGSSTSRSWKPILETILERSFNRRSESVDLVLDDHRV